MELTPRLQRAIGNMINAVCDATEDGELTMETISQFLLDEIHVSMLELHRAMEVAQQGTDQ